MSPFCHKLKEPFQRLTNCGLNSVLIRDQNVVRTLSMAVVTGRGGRTLVTEVHVVLLADLHGQVLCLNVCNIWGFFKNTCTPKCHLRRQCLYLNQKVLSRTTVYSTYTSTYKKVQNIIELFYFTLLYKCISRLPHLVAHSLALYPPYAL